MDFRKKGNREFFNNELLFKTVGIIFILGIFVLVFADIKIYQKKNQLVAQIGIYQKQVEDIKKSSQTLKEEIVNSNNIDYLEKLGYEQFGEARPGETEYMFINSGSAKKTEKNSGPVNLNLWTGWLSQTWNWIKTKF